MSTSGLYPFGWWYVGGVRWSWRWRRGPEHNRMMMGIRTTYKISQVLTKVQRRSIFTLPFLSFKRNSWFTTARLYGSYFVCITVISTKEHWPRNIKRYLKHGFRHMIQNIPVCRYAFAEISKLHEEVLKTFIWDSSLPISISLRVMEQHLQLADAPEIEKP